MLGLEGDIEIVGVVGRGNEGLGRVKETRPDVVLLVIETPGKYGLEVATLLSDQLPSGRVLILITIGRSGYLRQAMMGGVIRFLSKDAPAAQLANAIRRATAGELSINP